MEESFQTSCQNTTMGEEMINCYGHNENGTNETMLIDQHNEEMEYSINLERNIKYYCEGVILVPVAIVGLFGKKI